jgi:hypothetical protein
VFNGILNLSWGGELNDAGDYCKDKIHTTHGMLNLTEALKVPYD